MKENIKTNIGDIFKSKRIDLNLEISSVANYLKIKEKDLIAIENENWNEITKHIYKTGLIRSYAKVLKIENEIEDRIKELPFESNIKNSKHKLINIGEDPDLTPSYDMLINFLLLSILIFFISLAIYNSSEKKGKMIMNNDIIKEMETLKNNN